MGHAGGDLLYLVRPCLPADKEDSVQFPLEKPHSHEWSFPTVQSYPPNQGGWAWVGGG